MQLYYTRKKMGKKQKKNLYYSVALFSSFLLFIFYQNNALMATMLLGYSTEGILENNYSDLENNNFFNFWICFIAGCLSVVILIFFRNCIYMTVFALIYIFPFAIGLGFFKEGPYKNSCKKIIQKGFLRALIVVVLSIIGVKIEHFFPGLKIENYLNLEYFLWFFFVGITDILEAVFKIE